MDVLKISCQLELKISKKRMINIEHRTFNIQHRMWNRFALIIVY